MFELVTAWRCECNLCHHVWLTPKPSDGLLPRRCAKCKSRLWNVDRRIDAAIDLLEGYQTDHCALVANHEEAIADPTDEDIKRLMKPLAHDMKTCRLYGCALCTAAGKKF